MADVEQNQFDLFITCVDQVGPMLKVWGQVDRLSSMFVEQLLKSTSALFETDTSVVNVSKLNIGLLCCAKYKDGHYYRAQIINVRHLVSGSVEVKFIDYGNEELISIENIKLFENVPIGLTTIKPQAVDFILANVIHVNQQWDDKALSFIHSEIAYMELKSSIVGAINNYRFIKVKFHDTDLSEYLIQRGIVTVVSLAVQEKLLNTPKNGPPFTTPVPAPLPAKIGNSTQIQSQVITQPEFCTYKTLPLEPNSEHMVYISYVEDGPYLFSVQLQSMEETLEKLMIEINQIHNLLPLSESPLPGYPCMARCLEDNSLCRAVVINLVEDKCKIYYVDFGNIDILPFSNIFQIPFKYILPKVMSMRFTLAGLKNINVTNEMKCTFKEFVTNRLLKLKVLKLESSPVIQYCELFDDNNTNIISVLYDQVNDYKTLAISKGMKYNVIVSYIEGCKRFFVQLKEHSDSLNNLMLTLANTCENSSVLQHVEVGLPCVAFYSGDKQWYRATILSIANDTATVKYVDYGNEDVVSLNCIKIIDSNFVKMLPAQAIECCLYGYQNMSFNSEIESVFESLTLECEFTMKVISKQNNDATLLVDLFDDGGNNVAALLIEKLATQKSQLGSLPANRIARSLLNNEENINPNIGNQYVEIKSPTSNSEKPSWRNASNDNNSWKNAGNDKRNLRNPNDDKKSWRSNEYSPKNRVQNDNWNGDSPTNKRPQRNERSFSRNSNNSNTMREGTKFNKRSPHNDSGKGNLWNNSGSESEKSWSGNSVGNRGKNSGYKKDFKQGKRNTDFPRKNDFSKSDFSKSHEKRKLPVELPVQNLAPLSEPFNYMEITPEASESVSISWFYDPENFFCQLLKYEQEFRNIMNDIQMSYNGRPPLNTNSDIPVGSSVIAEFHEDLILYRAVILENKHPKYKVQYIDFGNISLVENNKIWQVEKKFMNLPMQAIKCSISTIIPADKNWPTSDVIDKLFNKDSFTCTFVGCDEEKYFVQLIDSGNNVRQNLIDLGIARDSTASCQMVDEPINLDALLGQNIKVRISYIQDLNKFFVHLQPDHAIAAQQSIESFMKTTDSTTLPQFSQDMINIGATCLVQTNNTWKRGVITNNSDMTSLHIDYPDYGGSGTHSSNEIYILPQELCVYWYQGFECYLHNMSDKVTKLISDEDFKTKYENKELIIFIDEIINGRLIVTLYNVDGKKLDLIEPDEGAYSTVESVCPMPVLHDSLRVYVSHVKDVNSVYLQRESDTALIENLLENLSQFYESNGVVSNFNKGDLCCAKSINYGNWYRGRIQEIKDDNLEILYIDYGNSETVPKENIKILDEAFYVHEFAINVRLNLQESSSELTSKLNELTSDKLLTANITYGDLGWMAVLIDGEININQKLVDLNLATFIENVSLVQETIIEESESDLHKSESVTIDNNHAQVTITHIDSPSEFYVQLITNEESIFALQADLQEKIKDLPNLEGADIGVLCAAKYTVDEQWYRAEVLDADSEITTVRFVDYGNTDVITNNQGSIKTLPADLLAIDKYARKCSLNVQPSKGEEWSQEASELFENAVSNDIIYVDIVYQDEKNKTYVDLFINDNNIANQLINANLAVPITRDVEDNIANNTGFVSHVNSISEFWIQLESSVPDLEMIVDRLANADTFADLQDLSPGILCAANFPDDEMWYRARILSNTVAGIEVLFVDYGNSSTAMKLKVLPEDLIQMPILAQKCSLSKPSTIKSWSTQANEKFHEISEDGATIFTIKRLSAGETFSVELFINGNNIIDQLVSLCDENSISDRMTPIGEPKFTKAFITHVETPSYFWVQLSSDSEKIDEMTENLACAGSFKKLTDWNADTTCAVLYMNSGLWYRAKILEYTDSYEVLLVDYGNTILTEDLRLLPDDLTSIPPLATLCSLELPKDISEWTDDMCSNFTTLVDGGHEFQIEFINNEVPSNVRLFINGKDIVEEIRNTCSQVVADSVNIISDEISLLAVSTHLPEPASEIDEVEEIDHSKAEVSMLDESYMTAKDDYEENSSLNDSNETVKEASFTETEADQSTHIILKRDNNSSRNFKILDTDEEQHFDDELNSKFSNKILDSYDDKIVSYSLRVTKNEIQNDTQNTVIHETLNQKTDEIVTISRPSTPHCDKIVPGSICRGDLEEPLEEVENQNINSETPNRPITPFSEIMVSDSICVESREQIHVDHNTVNISHIRQNENIVPEAISTGDLEKSLTSDQNETTEPSFNFQNLEEIRPKTPIDEKIVPGSINKGMNLGEQN